MDVTHGSEPKPYYLSDLLSGLVAVLAIRGVPVLSARQNRLDYAFEKLFPELEAEVKMLGFRPRFRIRRHPVHGESSTVREALYEAAQRNFLSFDNPEFQDVRIKITPDEAPALLEGAPGGRQVYERLASAFLRYYQDFIPT